MRLIDTHCHLDLYPHVHATLDEIERHGIYTIAVTNTPSVFRHCAEIVRESRFVRPAVGLHPELAAAREHELDLLDELLPLTRYVGEVGLDFVTQDEQQRQAQRRVFDRILDRCASTGDKILSVHSRRAAAAVLEMIGSNYAGTVILHWFSGPLSIMDLALARGCYFSINSAMVSGAAGRRILSKLPPERVLTETDGPFVTVNGRPTKPSDMTALIEVIARLWSVEVQTATRQLYENFRAVLTSQDHTEAPGLLSSS